MVEGAKKYISEIRNLTLSEINNDLEHKCGISSFFESLDELNYILDFDETIEQDKVEYGDFQTNQNLTDNIVQLINQNYNLQPDIIIEPTCGIGNFVLSALKFFNPNRIIAIEIFKPYVFETKLRLLDFFIDNADIEVPEITIIHKSIFDIDFDALDVSDCNSVLLLGNPPWVTNTELSKINSENLPEKSNFKKHNGLDAITGKGNFDISEYITLILLNKFSNVNGVFSFLIKNSVIKNLIHDQNTNNFRISEVSSFRINSTKEFSVSVESSVFNCRLNSTPSRTIREYDIYNNELIRNYGWIEQKFVSNLDDYNEQYDNECQITWRTGIKHDCSKVMELDLISDRRYRNKLNQEFELEDNLVYGLLKSSDLGGGVVDESRKYTIVTQKKVNEDTDYIKNDYPKTHNYLKKNKSYFDKRKSKIYEDKPDFSIFGIGNYSFKLYKVGISGLYKRTKFSLIMPINQKPTMLDDTCYFIGFDRFDFALITQKLLNKSDVQSFIKSIVFFDAKRPINKDILMRIDLLSIANSVDYRFFEDERIDENAWLEYQNTININQPLRLFN